MARKIHLFFVLLLVLGSSRAFAQSPPCPTTYPDLPLITWVDGGCVPATLKINGVDCLVDICYCYRAISSTQHDIIVRGVRVKVPGCGGVTNPMQIADVRQMFEDAADWLIDNNVLNLSCPTCGQGTSQQFRLVRAGCYEVINQMPDGMLYSICSGTSFCVRSISVCCDPTTGEPVVTDIASFQLNGTCPETCTAMPCATE